MFSCSLLVVCDTLVGWLVNWLNLLVGWFVSWFVSWLRLSVGSSLGQLLGCMANKLLVRNFWLVGKLVEIVGLLVGNHIS